MPSLSYPCEQSPQSSKRDAIHEGRGGPTYPNSPPSEADSARTCENTGVARDGVDLTKAYTGDSAIPLGGGTKGTMAPGRAERLWTKHNGENGLEVTGRSGKARFASERNGVCDLGSRITPGPRETMSFRPGCAVTADFSHR